MLTLAGIIKFLTLLIINKEQKRWGDGERRQLFWKICLQKGREIEDDSGGEQGEQELPFFFSVLIRKFVKFQS